MIEFYPWRAGALFCLLVFAPLLPAQSQTAPPGWVTTGAFRDFHVVIPPSPTPAQQHMGEVFQRYFKIVTDRDIGLSSEPEGLVNVWLGPAAVSSGLLREWDLENLGDEAFIIRTYAPHARHEEMGATKQLIIAGATDTGTLHGVYDFFRRCLDLHWLAPEVMKFIPPRYTLPEIDFQYQPPFEWRELGYHAYWQEAGKDYREAHHILHAFDPPEQDTLQWLLPADKYFSAHPEYFGLRDGARQATGVQPCLSNPETAGVVLSELLSLIRSEHENAAEIRGRVQWEAAPNTWTVSAAPDEPCCACAVCSGVIEKTSRASGLLARFVNTIAAGLAEALPEEQPQVHLVAAGITRRPPETVKLEENVIVQVSTREADYSRPMEDRESAINLALRRDLKGWSDLTRKLYVWDHAPSFATPLTPHPNLGAIQANLQFFGQFAVRGVYVDAWQQVPFSETDTLRAYLLGVHVWDPDYGLEKARLDFLRDYYVQALAAMMAYIDLITTRVQEEGVYLSCMQDGYWFDYGLVEEARAIFAEALAQRITPEVKLRVEQAQLPVEWAAMTCPPRIQVEANSLVFTRPPCLSLAELEARMREVYPAVPAEAFETVLAPLRSALGGEVPPREERHPFTVIENDRFLLWIAPSLDGAVVRFQDKQSKIELLRGYENYGAGAGVWTLDLFTGETFDWTLSEATGDAATLKATSVDGIEITRSIRLDGAVVGEHLTFQNTGAADLALNFRSGPELFIQERRATATLWIRPANGWQEIALPENDFGIARAQREIPPAAAHAVHLDAPDLTITAEVEGDPAAARFTYDGEHQHQMARIELGPSALSLSPGEAFSFALRYTVTSGAPKTTGSGAADEAGE